MYRLNRTYRNVLITPEEVIAKSPSDNTISIRKYLNAIEIAEERFIRPAICSKFYDAISAEKNKVVTDDNKADLQTEINAAFAGSETYQLKVGDIINASEFLSENNKLLWNTYLWKLTAECVRFTAIPEAYADFTEQGIMKNNPAIPSIGDKANESASIDLKDAKWLMDKWLMDRMDPLTAAMQMWICEHKGNYPLYCNDCGCGDADGISVERKTDWITSIYDDDEKGGCGC